MPPPVTEVVQSVSGLSMMNFKEAVGRLFGPLVVERGLARLAPTEREQLETMTPVVWVPVVTLAHAVDAWSEEAGVSPEELTVRGVRESTRRSFATVWRVLLHFTTDDALITRAPLLYARTRNAGVLSVELRAPRDAQLVLSRWRDTTDRQLLSLAVAFETVLELTGRPHARCTFRRTSDGGVFRLRWGDPSVPERTFPPRAAK
jgi:hypothetical protein